MVAFGEKRTSNGRQDRLARSRMTFYVVKGEFKLKLGDRIVSAPAESVMFVPRGTPHTFQNVGTEPGVILVGVTPGGFEKMFEEGQGVDAETNRALAKKYNMEVVGPPIQ